MGANTRLVEDFIALWDAPQGLDRAVEAYFDTGDGLGQ